jgi:hypothetical protein
VRWAHQVADRFPDGQLYVNLRGFDPSSAPVPPAQALHGFLTAFQIPAGQIPADLAAQAALYRSLLAGKRVLVLLDNARDAAQVRPLLPGSPGCLALVTSRTQLAGLAAAEDAFLLTLDVLAEAEAREMLAHRLGSQRIAAEPLAADELIGLCARLPLALSIAAARAAGRSAFRLAVLAAELREAHDRLDALDAGDGASDVRAVISWSYHELSAPSARMFRLLGLHPGPDISLAAAASLAGLPVRQAREWLDELTRSHLLAERSPGRFAFHDLLRAYAAERAAAQDDAERRAAVHRTLDHYLHTGHAAAIRLSPVREPLLLAGPQPGVRAEPLTDGRQALAWFQAEHRVLIAATMQAADLGFGDHAWQIPWTLASFLD